MTSDSVSPFITPLVCIRRHAFNTPARIPPVAQNEKSFILAAPPSCGERFETRDAYKARSVAAVEASKSHEQQSDTDNLALTSADSARAVGLEHQTSSTPTSAILGEEHKMEQREANDSTEKTDAQAKCDTNVSLEQETKCTELHPAGSSSCNGEIVRSKAQDAVADGSKTVATQTECPRCGHGLNSSAQRSGARRSLSCGKRIGNNTSTRVPQAGPARACAQDLELEIDRVLHGQRDDQQLPYKSYSTELARDLRGRSPGRTVSGVTARQTGSVPRTQHQSTLAERHAGNASHKVSRATPAPTKLQSRRSSSAPGTPAQRSRAKVEQLFEQPQRRIPPKGNCTSQIPSRHPTSSKAASNSTYMRPWQNEMEAVEIPQLSRRVDQFRIQPKSEVHLGLDEATLALERLVEETHQTLVRDGLLSAMPGLALRSIPAPPVAKIPSLDAVDQALEELQRGLNEIDHALAKPIGR